jgi:hypothetical protein
MDLLVDWRAAFRGAVEMLHRLRRELIRGFSTNKLSGVWLSVSVFPMPIEVHVESLNYYIGRGSRFADDSRGLTIYARINSDDRQAFVKSVASCMELIGFILFDVAEVSDVRPSSWLTVLSFTTFDPAVTHNGACLPRLTEHRTRVPN